MLKFVSAGVWGIQAIMAIVVLALSIELTKPLPPTNGSAETEIDAPTTTKYSAFCGGFGLAVAILGIIATFFDAIPAIIVMGADAVSGILLLAGGIAFAIGLRGVDCGASTGTSPLELVNNDIINRGMILLNNKKTTYAELWQLQANCKKATADQAMQFVTCGFVLATIALVFLVWRRNRVGGGRAYV
ncbi:hypothetical protein CGCF415_v011343 [Colletotrichum fructicola]|nr:hypothetical protein CGCF415_v011343 [Colletotrichum fructicola]KAF4929290.1 hypothetical protein CGCF245_v012192 [Colletotrichum fructicola]